jgi:hypothetical protein
VPAAAAAVLGCVHHQQQTTCSLWRCWGVMYDQVCAFSSFGRCQCCACYRRSSTWHCMCCHISCGGVVWCLCFPCVLVSCLFALGGLSVFICLQAYAMPACACTSVPYSCRVVKCTLLMLPFAAVVLALRRSVCQCDTWLLRRSTCMNCLCIMVRKGAGRRLEGDRALGSEGTVCCPSWCSAACQQTVELAAACCTAWVQQHDAPVGYKCICERCVVGKMAIGEPRFCGVVFGVEIFIVAWDQRMGPTRPLAS